MWGLGFRILRGRGAESEDIYSFPDYIFIFLLFFFFFLRVSGFRVPRLGVRGCRVTR